MGNGRRRLRRPVCRERLATSPLFGDASQMALKLRSVSLNLPFGLGGMEMEVSEAEARAAWHLYVEYATRVTSHPLAPRAGSVLEALDSLYSLFGTTRQVLREAGPEVARGPESLGPLAIRILNQGVRPFLVRWHSEVRADHSPDRELDAARRFVFDRELGELRENLGRYIDALAEIAGIAGNPGR